MRQGKRVLISLVLLAVHLGLTRLVPGIRNNGVSFGLEVPILAVVFLLIVLTARLGLKDGWWLIITGGWINLVDRLVNGGVTDYWRIPLSYVYNNLADYLIFVGIIWLIYGTIRQNKNRLRG